MGRGPSSVQPSAPFAPALRARDASTRHSSVFSGCRKSARIASLPVIAVGPGKRGDDGKILPLDVKVGDRILIGKYTGQEISVDGHDYVILSEDEVLAVVEGKESDKKKAA